MAIRIGINGFGRIGRNILRAAWDRTDLEIVHINDLTSDDMLAALLQNDSVHGRFSHAVSAVNGGIQIGDRVVSTTAERDPSKLPWGDKGVDIVLECTGIFASADKASAHRAAGAKRVIISAPAKGDIDATFVVGVNHQTFDADKHFVVSNASCTTNCLAPLAFALQADIGITNGLVTTVHSYTMDQNLLDGPHKDFRRARAAALNMVPTSTGAAKAIGLVMPELAGRLNGMAVRVPTPNVSLVDLVFTASRDTTVEEVNEALTSAANGPLKGVLEASRAPLVSSDLIGNAHSSIADLDFTQVIDNRLVKVLSWYDNEWGFSNRMADLAVHMGG